MNALVNASSKASLDKSLIAKTSTRRNWHLYSTLRIVYMFTQKYKEQHFYAVWAAKKRS